MAGCKQVLQNDIDLLHPPAELEKRKHKLKRLVQTPNSFFMCDEVKTICAEQPCSVTRKQLWCVGTARQCCASLLEAEPGSPRVALSEERGTDAGALIAFTCIWQIAEELCEVFVGILRLLPKNVAVCKSRHSINNHRRDNLFTMWVRRPTGPTTLYLPPRASHLRVRLSRIRRRGPALSVQRLFNFRSGPSLRDFEKKAAAWTCLPTTFFSICMSKRRCFVDIVCKDMVVWTGMVACYAENGCSEEALKLFSRMRGLCGLEALNGGKSVHWCVIKSFYEGDLYLSTALLDMCTKFEDIVEARQVFQVMPKNYAVAWSLMVSRFAQSDRCEEALDLFCWMRPAFVVPNQFTYASMLQACATMEHLVFRKQIHCHVTKVGIDSVVYVSNALMGVYGKCGKIEDSMDLFVEIRITK
ncbi:hypothetical protein DVH24_025162 [Malus domestica]|uniref:Pentatricopeptide repeat-containing protein n=1 Tax=Malus domestica TaxID=3750 RepID=A0A498HR82_MALDO|nr:hypothetical protein DVH24_025162 [Malus domestica]